MLECLKKVGHTNSLKNISHTFEQLHGNLRQPFIVRLKAEQHAAAMKVSLVCIDIMFFNLLCGWCLCCSYVTRLNHWSLCVPYRIVC